MRNIKFVTLWTVVCLLMVTGCVSSPDPAVHSVVPSAGIKRPPVNQNLTVSEERFLGSFAKSLVVRFTWSDNGAAREEAQRLAGLWTDFGGQSEILEPGFLAPVEEVGFDWSHMLRRGITATVSQGDQGRFDVEIHEGFSGLLLDQLSYDVSIEDNLLTADFNRIVYGMGTTGFPYYIRFDGPVPSSVLNGLRSKLKLYVYHVDPSGYGASVILVWDIGDIRGVEKKMNQALGDLGWESKVVFVKQIENALVLDWVE